MQLDLQTITAPSLQDLDDAVTTFANSVHQVMSFDMEGHPTCNITDPAKKIEFMLDHYPKMLQIIFMFNHYLKAEQNKLLYMR